MYYRCSYMFQLSDEGVQRLNENMIEYFYSSPDHS
jgi:hypothetical protein